MQICVVAYSRIIGLNNGTLSYNNGILKLTYGTSDAWNARTEVVFHCDPETATGSPSLEIESENFYSFSWYTAYACLPEAVTCSAMDSKIGLQYDLQRYSV